MAAVSSDRQALNAMLGRMASLRCEGLRIYKPLPHADPFHYSRSRWRVVFGSNRAGKTLVCAAESCRAWLGCDPYKKYRPTGGRSLVVGLDADHIGMLWTKCAQPGAFKMIRDEHTRLWRAVRYDPMNPSRLDPYDLAYREKWRDAPPLIPTRMIAKKGVAWYDRGQGIPREVNFKTGWSALFRPSGGPAPQGESYDHGWIDEQIENEAFYYELVRGMVGIGSAYPALSYWSATPQRQNNLLWELCQAAENGATGISTYFYSIEENPYVDEGERKILHDSLPEPERRVRYFGQHALLGWRIYPRFDPMGVHGYEPFEIPPHWTRYMALDPGTTNCATLFGAVDPEQRHLWIYGQMLLHNADASQWAARLAERPDSKHIYAWIIDTRAGRQKGMGGYRTFAAQYFHAAASRGLKPVSLGPMSGFYPGCDEPDARREAMAGKLWVRDFGPLAGTAELRIAHGACPDLVAQIQKAQFDSKNPTKRLRGDFDLLDAGEYLVAHNPCYVVYTPERPVDPVYRAFHSLQRDDLPAGNAVCAGMEIDR